MGSVSFELPAAGTYTVTAELNGQTVEQTVEVTENGQTTVLPISFPPQYTITLLVDPAGGGTVSGGGTVTEGQSVTVTAAASPDYTFSSWMENGAAVSTSATYTFTASADRTLTAVFAAAVKRFTVTTAIDPPGAGSATGAGMYDEGASVTVAASPGDGYQFSAWQEGGQTISSSPSYTFTVSANRALTAVFSVIPVYTITASIDPDGSGTITGAGQYQEGQTVTLVAAPADGYEFTGWQENGETASTDTTYSFTATADRTLTAAFASAVKELVYVGAITPLGMRRQSLAAVSVGNYALFGGGYRKGPTMGYYYNNVDAYDTSLTRTTPTALSVKRNNISATTVGNYALVGGGYDGSDDCAVVDAYDTNLTHTTPPALSRARYSLAATTVGNYALFGGGATTAVVDAYDSSLTHTTPTALSVARYTLASTTVGNYALFGGGYAYSTVVDAYDTSLTRTTPTALGAARGTLAATTVGNYALFGGGQAKNSVYPRVVDAYDTSLTHTLPTYLSNGRGALAATTVGNYALFGGGATTAQSAVVDAYDTSLTHTTTTSLSVARNALAATIVGNYALFGGGYTGSDQSAVVDAYTIE